MESFASRQAAQRFRDEAERQAEGRTVSHAVAAFVLSLRARGLRASTERTFEHRLTALLELETKGEAPLWRLTPTIAAAAYARRVAMTKVDTHHGELVAAKQFGVWCAKRGWLRANPFAEIVRVGRKSRGRPQLRIDEARRFVTAALEEGTAAGDAAALALLLGLRASEVTDRIVRDVDDECRVLWVTRSKTAAGVRTLAIPPVMQERLAGRTAGRAPTDRLWGNVTRSWLHHHVVRLCAVAGVPRVTPQGLRGLHATLALEMGVRVDDIARSMGHSSPAVTRAHYFAPGEEDNARTRRVLAVLRGSQPGSQPTDSPATEPPTN
jgi:integrase